MLTWMGKAFEESGIILSILLFAIFPVVINANASNVLAMSGHHRFTARTYLFTSFFNICLSIILIQFWGLAGVAIGTLVAACATQSILINYICRINNIPFRRFFIKSIWPIIPPMIPTFLGVYLIKRFLYPSNVLLVIIEVNIGILIYIGFMLFLSLNRDERRKYKQVLTRFIKRK